MKGLCIYSPKNVNLLMVNAILMFNEVLNMCHEIDGLQIIVAVLEKVVQEINRLLLEERNQVLFSYDRGALSIWGKIEVKN